MPIRDKSVHMYGFQQERGYEKAPAPSPRGRLHDGTRQFMNGVYLWMAAGVSITGVVAWGVSTRPSMLQAVWGSPLGMILSIGTFIMALALQRMVPRMDRSLAAAGFFVYAAMMGVALSYVPMFYPVGNIAGVMAATVGMFAGMAAIGYVTKKDLSGMGQFMVMALLGAIIASLVNGFLIQSASMSLGISALIAAVSAGLTAYYTQAIKQLYRARGGRGNLAVLGALVLYINFINMFLSLLRLFGGSRD